MLAGCNSLRRTLLEGNGHYCFETLPPPADKSNEDDIWFSFRQRDNPKYQLYLQRIIFLRKGYVIAIKNILKDLPEETQTRVLRILAYNAVKLTKVLDQDLFLPKQLKKIKDLEEDIRTLGSLNSNPKLELIKFNRADILKKDRLQQFADKLKEQSDQSKVRKGFLKTRKV